MGKRCRCVDRSAGCHCARFYDGRGRLSAYAFACGYVERFAGVALEREHGTYHAKRAATDDAPHAWESAATLREGRALAAKLRREVREAIAERAAAFAESEALQAERGARDACATPARVTCGSCGRAWCEHCDPAPAALCHYCHGRGYTAAALDAERAA